LVLAMMVGSFLTGRLVGRVRQGAFVATGFAIALVGSGFAVVYQTTAEHPVVAWTVAPAAAASLGVALIFPILTISLLDLRPRERGAVSSFQSFLSTLLNAVVAGAVSPFVSGSLAALGLVAGGLTFAAMLLWLWHRKGHRSPDTPVGLPIQEPTEQL
jgi:DHA1 family bicyclomycin/chloramphenicol resistance-like MFS transporter